MRSLFQYALPHGDNVAEDLLDQIYALAQEALEVSGSVSFLDIHTDFYRVSNLTRPRNLSGSPQRPLIEPSTSTVPVKMFPARRGHQRRSILQAAVLMEEGSNVF